MPTIIGLVCKLLVEICCWVAPFEVPQILVYTLSFAFALLYQQGMSIFGGLQINVYHRELKAIWKVWNNRFPILELLFDPKKEASRWKLAWQGCYAASQLNL
jgi:hypothetical protein